MNYIIYIIAIAIFTGGIYFFISVVRFFKKDNKDALKQIVLCFKVVPLLFSSLFLVLFIEDAMIYRNRIETIAIVSFKEQFDNEDKPRCLLTLDYSDGDGTNHRVKYNKGLYCNEVDINDKVEIYYNKNNPSTILMGELGYTNLLFAVAFCASSILVFKIFKKG